MFETMVATITYIINASFFYPAMGMTAATSIWIGAAMYNGDIKAASKGVIVLASYAGLLLLTTIPRVMESLSKPDIIHSDKTMAYAGAATILFLTIYYILGMAIGVYTVQRARR